MDALNHTGSTGFVSCDNASAIEALYRQQLIKSIAASRGKFLPNLLHTKARALPRKR